MISVGTFGVLQQVISPEPWMEFDREHWFRRFRNTFGGYMGVSHRYDLESPRTITTYPEPERSLQTALQYYWKTRYSNGITLADSPLEEKVRLAL